MRRGSFVVVGALLAACTTATPPTPTAAPTHTTVPTATAAPTQATTPAPTPRATPAPTPTPTSPPTFAELVGAVDSAGCANAAATAGDSSVEVEVDGTVRTALLHVPQRLGEAQSVPLVLVLHGTFMNGADMAGLTGYSAVADERGFLVAYPDPTDDFPGWNAGESSDQVNDVAFLSGLLDQLEATYCVDTRRIFAAGLSAGGPMAHTTACRDVRVTAISMVSSGFAVDEPICEPKAGIPTVVIQGVLDPLIPWFGGRIPLPELSYLPAVRALPDWTADIAVQNGCDADADALELPQIGDWVVPFEWQSCSATTILYRVGNGGHNWPGGTGLDVFGNINRDISASELSYDFFLANSDVSDPRAFEDPAGSYVVHLRPGWPPPLAGRFFEGNEDEASVTFPIDALATIIVSSAPIAEGVPTGAGIVRGSTAPELADALMVLHPDWVRSPSSLSVDGEPVVTLRGTNYLAYVASFVHRDRAFLVYVFSDGAGFMDTRPTLATFLGLFEFTD